MLFEVPLDHHKALYSRPPPGTAAAALEVLWNALADVLGSAATATLLRRAVTRGARRKPALLDVAITREKLEYRYATPTSWSMASDEAMESFRLLVRELRPLLAELTGEVVLRRLHAVTELRQCGLFPDGPQDSG